VMGTGSGSVPSDDSRSLVVRMFRLHDNRLDGEAAPALGMARGTFSAAKIDLWMRSRRTLSS
jgi:hypothetical protein